MTLHQIQIFAAVAKRLSITNAAKDLHLSQPAVSQQLKLLEAESGLKLYKKKKAGMGIEVTEEGRLFLTDVEIILTHMERLKEKFGNYLKDKEKIFFKVGVSYAPSISFLPTLLRIFKETHPHVDLTLRTDRSRILEQLALGSEVDLALITIPSHLPSLVYEPYLQLKMVAFASARHPLAKKKQVTLSDLARAPFIVFQPIPRVPNPTEEVLKDLERNGLQPNIFMHCDSPQAVKAAVKAGVGIGFLFQETLEPELTKGELKILKTPDPKVHFDSFIIYPKEKSLSPHAQEFLALLRDWPRKSRWVKGCLRAGNPISFFPSPRSHAPG